MSVQRILVLAGPSAVGKTTVGKEITRLDPTFTLLRSATTRAPRGDGNDGEYIYLSREEFSSRIQRGEMLEYMEYAGELYGTPRSEVSRALKEGKTPLLILDLEGVSNMSRIFGVYPMTVYITGSSEALASRLAARYGVGTERYLARMEQNERDARRLEAMRHLFTAFVRNDTTPTDCARLILSGFYERE